MGARVSGRLLGGFEISVDGRRLEPSAFERPSGTRLLKLLLATPEHRIRREVAAELLWPEADPERSAANLRKAIHFAKRATEHPGNRAAVIRGDGEWLRIDDSVELDLDLDRLRAALAVSRSDADGRGVAVAGVLIDLAGAELLPEDPYEEWLAPLRERIRIQSLEGLLVAAREARDAGQRDLAFQLIDRLHAIDPADEDGHRLAIELHLDGGRLHAARRQLLAATRTIADAYGIAPSRDLVGLVEAALATRARPRIPNDAEPPIVGRRKDLEAAEPALDAVAANRLGVVAYRGPAGIGKSRVLRELVRAASSSGWRTAEVRALESSPDVAFGAIGAALAEMLGEELPAGLAEPGRSALLTIAPRLGQAPQITFASDGALAAALVAGLSELASAGPIAIALDDVQWVDRPTTELLASVLARLRDAPILVLASLRDAPDPPPPAAEAFLADVERAGGRVIPLGPILPRELNAILERDAGGRVEPALVDAIAARAGGAPLLALEIFRGARDAGLIVERAGRWRLDRPSSALPIPRSVNLMVERRTATLPPEVTRILSVAAELSDEVSMEQLVLAGETESPAGESERPGGDAGLGAATVAEAVLAALDRALEAGLMVERSGRYAFAHPLFRAALRTVRPHERAALHARVARALAAGVDPTDRAEIDAALAAGRDVIGVAVHAHEAAALGRDEATALAIGFGLAAGERQAGVFDHPAAVEILRRSLALWERLPPEAARRYPAAPAYLRLGWSCHATADEAGASAAFRTAARHARDDRERAEAWQAAAWMPYQHGEFDTADSILREALEEIADPVARAGIESDRAWIVGRRGGWARAYEQLSRAVTVMEQGGAPIGLLARSLDRLGVALRDSIDAPGAIGILDRGLRLARECGDERLAATIEMHLAGAYRRIGDHDRAGARIESALASTAMTGDRYIEAVTIWIAAEIAHARGALQEAIDLRRRELEILSALGGNEHNQAMAHAHVAHLARLVGDDATADAHAIAARSIARHSTLTHLSPRIERRLAGSDWFDEDPPTPGAPWPGSGNDAGTRIWHGPPYER